MDHTRPTDSPNNIPEATGEEARRAVDLARRAADRWSKSGFDERKEYLLTVRDVLVDRMDEILHTITLETGKTRGEALAAEVMTTADLITYYARRAGRVLAPKRVSTGLLKTKRATRTYEPYGVVGIISPWNYPFYLTVAPIVTALAAGNTVVLKPSEITPLTGVMVGEIFAEATKRVSEALPDADVNVPLVKVLSGDGRAGEALVTSGVDKIAFTGSVETGKKVMAAAAKTLTPVLLELGGKDPMIVCDDANLDRAARAAVWGAFSNTGQACISVERVYVDEKVHDEFVERVLRSGRKVRLGEDIGPLTFPPQLDIVEDHIDDARRKGAEIPLGGYRDASRGGLYHEPTVLTGVDHSMKIMREETFGPVLPIMKVGGDEEAIRLANDSPYGLNSSVFSRSVNRARGIARRLQTGGVCINDCLISSAIPGLPYGGRRESGFGYAHGDEGLIEFSIIKAIAEDRLNLPREPQWFPGSRAAAATAERLAKILYNRNARKRLADRLSRSKRG